MDDSATASDTTQSVVSAVPEEPVDASIEVPADGEIKVLMESLEAASVDSSDELSVFDEEDAALSSPAADDHGESVYGKPLSVEEAAEKMPPGSGGMLWTIMIIPDEFFTSAKKLGKVLRSRDFDRDTVTLKPRRANLPVRASNFFSSLTKVGPRYIFNGVINGWPGLKCFEMISLERKGSFSKIPVWKHHWSVDSEGTKGLEPKPLDERHVYRAVLRGAPWTAEGWSKDSPGFAFWYEAQIPKQTPISYGTNMLESVEDAVCTHIHMVSHRYAIKRESPRDLITYHSCCLLEWDHGKYTTVLETAYLNGIGGYKGKSNWYDDRDEHKSKLYQDLPPEMILPWRTNSAEIRCYDVKAKTIEEFMDYLQKYRGNLQRFIDPRISFSHPARLTFRSKKHIAQYVLSYITRDSSYADLRRNCQTFAADMCSFVAGKKDIAPFHPVSRIEYQNRTYLFLYDSHMYTKKADKRKLGKKS